MDTLVNHHFGGEFVKWRKRSVAMKFAQKWFLPISTSESNSLSQWTRKKKVWTLFSLLNMESPKVEKVSHWLSKQRILQIPTIFSQRKWSKIARCVRQTRLEALLERPSGNNPLQWPHQTSNFHGIQKFYVAKLPFWGWSRYRCRDPLGCKSFSTEKL